MAPDDKLMLPIHGRSLLRHLAERVLDGLCADSGGPAPGATPKVANAGRFAFAQGQLSRQR